MDKVKLFEAVRATHDFWLAKLAEDSEVPPTELHHYTSGAGLLGIASSGAIHGSNYAFMNDRSEFQYAATLLQSTISAAAGATRSSVVRRVMSMVASQPLHDGVDIYLSCFCEASDLLSQWRGYGGEESRYCIQFDATRFRQSDTQVSGLVPVLYDEDAQRAWLADLAKLHVDLVESSRDLVYGDSDDDNLEDWRRRVKGRGDGRMSERELAGVVARSIQTCAIPLITRFKDPAFVEEREWRCVLIDRGENLDGLAFLESRGVVKPFRTLLTGSSDTDRLPITAVIVGSNRFDDQAAKSAQLILRRFGYEDVDVRRSRVPLRL